nr:hypothetical protein [Tanacetum cinerariifolium]
MRRVNTFVPIDSEVDRAVLEFTARSLKRSTEEELDQGSSKRKKTNEALGSKQPDKEENELSQEDLQQIIMVVPVEEVYVEALLRYMHDPLTWRLYDTCRVHHVSAEKRIDIFMLVEKEYPLSKGILTLMLVNKLDQRVRSQLIGKDLVSGLLVYEYLFNIKMTKVIKGEFEKLESVKEEDSEQQMSHESDDDLEYDPSDVKFTEWSLHNVRSFKGWKLKEEALKNKAIMDGMIDEDDESSNEGWKRWDDFEINNQINKESENEMEHEEEERCEVFDDHERPVCYIRRLEMIKYSFRGDKEYVATKENEYDNLTNTSKDAIHVYQ